MEYPPPLSAIPIIHQYHFSEKNGDTAVAIGVFHEVLTSKVYLPQSDAILPTSCHDIIYWDNLVFK